MSDEVPKRERIVLEVIRRLKIVFPTYSFNRGFFGEKVETMDSFYIFDLPEACEMTQKGRGQYQCAFGLSISLWTAWDEEEMYPAGNRLLDEVRLAIEIDEYLKPDADQSLAPLVTRYYMDEGALIWYDEGVIDTELLYVVEYTKEAGWMQSPFVK